ncbi:MAG: mandelate racemase/muconate lactonizing enzyme family protein [Halobacteriales archaeon]
MTGASTDLSGESERFELPLKAPLSTAAGTIKSRDGLLVWIHGGGGNGGDAPVGVGEATPLPGWTESLEECQAAVDRALDRLEAHGPEAALAEASGAPAARHGVSLALLDREARASGEPLYRHVGKADQDVVSSVPVNATVGDGRIMETVGMALEAVRDGFGTLKVKVGARETAIDAERLEAIRSEVSDTVGHKFVEEFATPGWRISPSSHSRQYEDLRLRVDANGAWSRSEARLAIDAFPDLEYVEQPLAPDDLAGHADLRSRATIALDETLIEHAVEDVIDAGAADVLVLKPMVLGGIDRAWTAAMEAREAGIDPVVTTTIDGVVARTAAVHLAAGLEIDRACGLATADRLDTDLAPDPTRIFEGRISVPQAPGIGVSVE